MLKWRVNEIVAAHQTMTGNRLTQEQIGEGTGLARTTVAKIVNGDGMRADMHTVNALLNYLNAVVGPTTPGDLFLYVYDGKYDPIVLPSLR